MGGRQTYSQRDYSQPAEPILGTAIGTRQSAEGAEMPHDVLRAEQTKTGGNK